MDSHRPRQISQSDCETSSNCGKKLHRNTELARAVDVIYILTIVVNKLFFFFFVAVFSKRNREHVLRVPIEL